MRRQAYILLLFLAFCSTLWAEQRIRVEELLKDWNAYQGQYVCITNPLIVCGVFRDSIILAPERLFVPEERAEGLADGDSTMYWQRVGYNDSLRISLHSRHPYYLNLGATVTRLRARVIKKGVLSAGREPTFKNWHPSKRLPKRERGDLMICSANIQNYFVHLGGYASKRTTPEQHALQQLKTATALKTMDADLYALCELERGPSAPQELVDAMNRLARCEVYDFVRTGAEDGDTIAVGFIYRKDRVRPCGPLLFAYADDMQGIYAHRFILQGFEQISTGERLVVSLNHPRSKRGDPDIANAKRMNNIRQALKCIHRAYADSLYTDPDILWLGDYNCYRYEQPVQTIVRAGFADLSAVDSTHYTYSYRGECGTLDRVFASPTMAEQVKSVQPVHWNTDYYYSAAFWSKYNFTANGLTRQAKRNMLFRYSDHDAVLIRVALTPRPDHRAD